MGTYILVGDSFTSFSKEVAFAEDVAIVGNKKEIKKYRVITPSGSKIRLLSKIITSPNCERRTFRQGKIYIQRK